ncbi:metal-sulfur cluster assembly factor [Azospirillum canadense]|uniref:metal-sulfur cluster assembly factor n=1 Tax=Azospirillum canadense TaxID=403962 RepID=UPI002227FE48|nr:metal-sulfur cluster assembly factor [Azospirillum canadense]MCW2241504.1 metal-sulfur cluster biosynthetic enzyme [Azospirillum canadense]
MLALHRSCSFPGGAATGDADSAEMTMAWKRYLSQWMTGGTPRQVLPAKADETAAPMPASDLGETVRRALRTVDDPEVGLNIVDLGLVYAIHASRQSVHADITLTTPTCPLGETVVDHARTAIAQALPNVADVTVRLVWEPRWTPAMMSSHARKQLGW